MLQGVVQKAYPELRVKNTILRNVQRANEVVKLAEAGFYYVNLDRDLTVSYTHLRAHETSLHLVCRLLLEKKNNETSLHLVCRLLPFPYGVVGCFFFLMIRRPPRSTQGVSSAASDVYKRQLSNFVILHLL